MPSVDPYLAWAQSQQFAGFAATRSPGCRVPVLLQLLPGQFDALLHSGKAIVPGVYGAADAFVTAQVYLQDLAAVEAMVDRLEFSIPVPVAARPRQVAKPAAGPADAVIAVIDRGCAVLNECFRKDARHTRFVGVWQQGVECVADPWRVPDELGYGRELRTRAINDTLTRLAQSGGNEADEYRRLGLLLDEDGQHLRSFAHGTHVLDTAAGRVLQPGQRSSAKPAQDDAASVAPLIFVEVPELGPGDTCGASSGAFLLDALRYIRLRAGQARRVVVNVSLGALAGPHDGSSLLEQAVDDFLKQDGHMIVVVAAGNAGDTLACPWHARGRLDPAQPQARLHWRLRPDDPTDSFVEIWWRPAAADANEPRVTLTGPDGVVTAATPAPAAPAAQAVFARAAGALGRDAMLLVAVAPCAGARRAARAGLWTIQLDWDGNAALDYDAWIQRDEPIWTGRTPVQSFFECVEGAAQISAEDTLNSLGSGQEVLLAGARARGADAATRYSSHGPAGPAGRPTTGVIQLLAAADESEQVVGLMAAGAASGTCVRMGGTSVAAPVGARHVFNTLTPASRTPHRSLARVWRTSRRGPPPEPV